MSLEALHRVLEANGARRLSRGWPVYALRKGRWPLFGRLQDLHRRQLAVLESVRSLPWPVFVRSSEDPRGWELPAWPRAARDTWLLPRTETARSLLDGILEAGAWTLYLAPHALDPALLPDTFHAELAEVAAFAESHSVPVLLDAWHDNAEWRILVEAAAVPGLAAA